jgi:hypothetical protein
MFNGTGQSIQITNISATFTSSAATGGMTGLPCGVTPFSGQTAIGGLRSCGFITYPAVTVTNTSGTHSDSLSLSLNPNLVAAPGAYTGNLLISAQAN